MLTKIENENDTTLYRCNMCACFTTDKDHVCDPDRKPEEMQFDDGLYLLQTEGIVAYEKTKEYNRVVAVEKIKRKFNENIMRQIILAEFKSRIVNANAVINSCFEDYAELSKKGIPFKQRINMLNTAKIDSSKKEIEKLEKHMKIFSVRDMHDWIQIADYELMKKIGMKSFIKLFFNQSYVIPKEDIALEKDK